MQYSKEIELNWTKQKVSAIVDVYCSIASEHWFDIVQSTCSCNKKIKEVTEFSNVI